MSSPTRIATGPVPAAPRWLSVLAILGAAGFVLGLFIEPDRAWTGYLIGFHYFGSLALAGAVFIAFLALSGARWATALRRLPEAMTKSIPLAGLVGVGLLFGLHNLYEWSHADVVSTDALIAHKSPYLNTTGFGIRLIGGFLLWIWLARLMVTRSRRVDADPTRDSRAGDVKLAAVFLAVFAITWSLANFDWLMSLEPHWFSTMFSLYHLAGLACAGLSAVIILAIWLERRGTLHGVLREEHLHDMGKLLFALTRFWVYLWYCQYMLIWYVDIPEETGYYLARKQGPWWLLVQTTMVLKWGVPFLALMGRKACRNRTLLVRIAGVVLVGHALDLYVQVGPPMMGSTPLIGVWEIAPLVALLALFFRQTIKAFAAAPVVPQNDPRLQDSLSYHTN
jgi:hypothetical protein